MHYYYLTHERLCRFGLNGQGIIFLWFFAFLFVNKHQSNIILEINIITTTTRGQSTLYKVRRDYRVIDGAARTRKGLTAAVQVIIIVISTKTVTTANIQ